MFGLEKIDNKTVAKQLEAAKLREKVLVVFGVLFLVVAAWMVIENFIIQESTLDPEIKSLAQPFNFSLNQEVGESLVTKRAIGAEELADFPIYLVDETSLSRSQALNVNLAGDNYMQEENLINYVPEESYTDPDAGDWEEPIELPEEEPVDDNLVAADNVAGETSEGF